MRIGLIAPPWFPVPPSGYGGTERVVAELAEGLCARGHEVTLYAAPGSESSATVRSPLDRVPDPATLGNPWDDATHALEAYSAIREFDVVHDHSGLIGPAVASVMAHRVPVVHTLHGAWTPQARRFYPLIDGSVHLVAISRAQAVANPSVRYAGMVHNGLSPALFHRVAEKDDRLVFVGRASPDKGIVEAIEVARRARLPMSLLVKANEPDEVAYWRDVVEPQLGSDLEVIFNAGHAVKVDRLARARAMVFPLRWEEPFGLVMIEALACGTPVVAFARGAAPEIVVDGESGFLVEPGAGLDELLGAVLRTGSIDPAACRARFEKHFSAERMVDGYELIYDSVSGGRVDLTESARSRPPRRALRPRVGAGAAGLAGPRRR